MTEGLYAIVVDPRKGLRLEHLPNGKASLKELYSIIGCDIVELSVLTKNGLELYVDEEGFVNGSANNIGVFQLQDADGERLGQVMYAGIGVILEVDHEFEESDGFEKERAEQIMESLIVQTAIAL